MNFKKYLPSIIIGLILTVAGFFIGRETGFADGYKSCEINYKYKDADEIKNDIKNIESNNIVAFLEAKAGIIKKKEGPLFKKHFEAYFSGIINNNATWANAKDISLKIDFFSIDNDIVGSDTIVLLDSIAPKSNFKFNEKISVPKTYEQFEFLIINAKSD